MAADVVGVPPPPARHGRPRGHDPALHDRRGPRLLRHQRPVPAERPRRLSSAAGDPSHRHRRVGRLDVPALFPSRAADARSGLARRGLQARHEPQDRDPLLRRRLRVFGLRPVHLQAAPARLRRSGPAAVPRRRGPARPLRLEPHHAGRADLALARPRRRDPVVAHRRRDRRHLGLLRRPHRLRDPARDRVRARDPEHPDLARALGRDAAQLAGDHAVFHDHLDPVAHRLGAARPRGARPLPVAAHRGVRDRGAARRLHAKGGSSSATCCRAS